MARYTVLLEYDPAGEGGVVTVPKLPGFSWRCRDLDELGEPLRLAIAAHVAALRAAGEPVPVEKPLRYAVMLVDPDRPCSIDAAHDVPF
jgi:predicted RNase H-like HicB family nuclease